MGTHKSRHNKGRKPMYKHFTRETARTFSDDERQKPERIIPAVSHLSRYKSSAKSPDLLPLVEAYLEKRKRDESRLDSGKQFPKPEAAKFSFVDGEEYIVNEHVGCSQHDVLLQLFSEHKISAGQLHAGRRWQADRELATIQACSSIDWSRSRLRYQAKGNLTDPQSDAMERRRFCLIQMGTAPFTFLDFCLEVDRGRIDLMALLRIDGETVARVVDDLLWRYCKCVSELRDQRIRLAWKGAA